MFNIRCLYFMISISVSPIEQLLVQKIKFNFTYLLLYELIPSPKN